MRTYLSAFAAAFAAAASAAETNIVSVTWGKSCNYVPRSTEAIDWSGELAVSGGELAWFDRLSYKVYNWSQQGESSKRLYTAGAGEVGATSVKWAAASRPGAPMSLEGARFAVVGGDETSVAIAFPSKTVRFTIGDLRSRERIRFRVGGKFTGAPVDVFFGPDARPRVSAAAFFGELDARRAAGALVVPDDFAAAAKTHYHSMYAVELPPGGSASATFALHNAALRPASGLCRLRLQLTGKFEYSAKTANAEERMEVEVEVGGAARRVPWVYTMRMRGPKLDDVYVDVPWSAIGDAGNVVVLRHLGGPVPVLVHRIYVNADVPSIKWRLAGLPPLPERRSLHVGTETDMLVPDNGDVEAVIDSLHDEQWGDFVKFRERSAHAPPDRMAAWCRKVREYGFVASLDDGSDTEAGGARDQRAILAALPKENYTGVHGHEFSNLAYGWGDPDPDEVRTNRTLAGCEAAYLERMKAFDSVGQAVPAQHLDYAAGVKIVFSELPCSHAGLLLSAARGAARAYGKDVWGVHLANHVTRCPLDEDHVRRLFILSSQAWLDGARIIYDEEVALRYNHDTVYAYSDPLPTAYRRVYQDLYHYGNAIDLGREIVRTCFLQGRYDFVIGGLQAQPTTVRTKFWGQFGPETAGWDFDTPEAGWRLLESFMPGVWLYPVEQDPKAIRLFTAGSPRGQVDLTPITAPLEVLSTYPLMVLPGWNTMTDEIYAKLVAYVRGGGHLVLSAAQCTRHVTRGFLVGKRGFDFVKGGDFSELAGVRVRESDDAAKVTTVDFAGERFDMAPGAPSFVVELAGGRALATDQLGRPFLVENSVGAGRVWMLTAGDYWGNPAFESFNRALCGKLSGVAQGGVRLSGETEEVDCHLYDCGAFRRLVLLNTDWSSARNVKRVGVCAGGLAFDAEVREGFMRHVLIGRQAAVGFEVPSAVVDGLSVAGDAMAFAVQGRGEVEVDVASARALGDVDVAGATGTLQGGKLRLEMGDAWSTATVRIAFAAAK